MYHFAKEVKSSDSIFNMFQNPFGSNKSTGYTEYESAKEFTTLHDFPQHINNEYICGTNYQIIKQNYGQSTNIYEYESNTRVRNWLEGCEVLGFIPDDCQSSDSTQDCTALPNIYSYSQTNRNNESYAKGRCGCISNTVKPSHTMQKTNMKRKRKRTIFTTEQIIALEGVFQKKPYINREERAAMTNTLRVSERAIKVWFQNRRRLTDKRERGYASDSPKSEDVPDTLSERLTFIESQIKDNTDRNGYVTLDDNVINELAGILDDYLPRNVDTSTDDIFSNPKIIENTVVYEPISPATTIEDSEDMEENITESQDSWSGYTNFL